MNLLHRWQEASRRQRIAAIAVLVWCLYAAAGYWLLSPWIRSTVQQTVAELTGREVELGRAVFNPATLSLSLQDFAIRDADGQALVAFDEFYINFQLSSLLRWSWHFDSISLYAPRVRLVQQGEQQFNVDDILARLSASDAEEDNSEPAEPTRLPRLSFRELMLVQGDFRFRDEFRDEPDELVLAPVSFQVNDFSTRADGEGNNSFAFVVTGPGGGSLDWEGTVSFEPLLARGRLALSGVDLAPFAEFVQHQIAFRMPSAMLDIATDYHFEGRDDGRFQLSGGRLALNNLEVRDPALDAPVLTLPLLELSGIGVDTMAQAVEIDRLLLQSLTLDVRLQDEGLNLVRLTTPVMPARAASEAEDQPAPEIAQEEVTAVSEAETAPWSLLLRTLDVQEATITVTDDTLNAPASFTLAPINLTLTDLAWQRDERFTLRGDLVLADAGTITLNGAGQLDPLSVRLETQLAALPLPAFQGWVQDSAAVQLASGELSGTLLLQQGGVDDGAASEDDTRLSGQITVSNLALRENNGEPLLGFSALVLDGIDLSLLKARVAVDVVTLSELRARSLIDADGRDVAVRIAVPAAQQVVASTPAEQAAPWQVQVNTLRLRNGELLHEDQSLVSVFRAGLYRLDGEVRGLSTDPKQPAQINLTARLDQVSPLTVSGKLAPLTDIPQMDLALTLNGYDMNSLTPFTGQYLGYAVESGQLAVDSRVAISGSVLDSETRIRAANFFLGDSIPSDEALKAPIKLGLAVLRDRSGMIDLPVKARGDLNDPSVSVSGIILRALTNVMIKAATSPFSALAALAGGEELDHISFVPGTDQPSEAGRNQMATLAQLLGERPSLLINLSGAVAVEDRVPFAGVQLGTQLLGGGWPGLEQALENRDFRRAATRRYREVTGNSAEALLGETVIEDRDLRERRVAELAFQSLATRQAASITEEQLGELAMARARRSKTVLVEEFGLDGERLFIVGATLAGEAAVSGVLLTLEAR